MFFNEWIEIVLFQKKPEDYAGTTLGEGLKQLLIAALIYGVFNGILQTVAINLELSSSLIDPAQIALYQMVMPFMLPLAIIAGPIFTLIGILITGAFLQLFCKLVGGQAQYGNFTGVLAKIGASFLGTVTLVLTIITIPAVFVSLPVYLIVSMLIGIISLIVSLWQYALTIMATSVVQKISIGNAFVALFVIPLAITLVLFVIMVIIGIALFASLFGAMGSTWMGYLGLIA